MLLFCIAAARIFSSMRLFLHAVFENSLRVVLFKRPCKIKVRACVVWYTQPLAIYSSRINSNDVLVG